MRSGGCAGRGAGVLTGGVVDGLVHQCAGMSSARSGLVRRVLDNSEVGSCTARVKRARSSGVSAAQILSAESLSTASSVMPSRWRHTCKAHRGRYPPAVVLCHIQDLRRRRFSLDAKRQSLPIVPRRENSRASSRGDCNESPPSYCNPRTLQFAFLVV